MTNVAWDSRAPLARMGAKTLNINVFEQQILDDNVAFAVQMHFPVISICIEHGRHLPVKADANLPNGPRKLSQLGSNQFHAFFKKPTE